MAASASAPLWSEGVLEGGAYCRKRGRRCRRRWRLKEEESLRVLGLLGPPSRAAVDAARRGLRVRNALTGFGIGAIVVGIYGYTLYSVSQERFLDELELEAEVVRARAAKTPEN